jgi:hypothetical protein
MIKIPARVPAANTTCERIVGSIRRELSDRNLIVNTAHTRKVPGEDEAHFNTHRLRRSLRRTAPLRAHSTAPADPALAVIKRDRLSGAGIAVQELLPRPVASPILVAVPRYPVRCG